MYGVYHGPEGLRKIATRIHQLASTLAFGLNARGWRVNTQTFFDTITVEVSGELARILDRAKGCQINLRKVKSSEGKGDTIGISCDETTTREVIEELWRIFGTAARGAPQVPSFDDAFARAQSPIVGALARTSPFMTHPVFHRYRSETDLLRYMRRLADRDLALDRSMIPLGSCTMKLNATAEMIPITWPEFANLHPFAPADQAAGYAEMFEALSAKLREITGYDAISLQPNSGAQGEFAGLLAIRGYYRSRGDKGRNVCLIPTSAHGTNPASAHLAGMDVIPVKCTADGDIDIVDLRAKAAANATTLAAMMVTYPSTHGVFEERIRKVCDIIHEYGGQVYLDGANLNAQVGLCRPADYGADVSHLNLHKTFCIPHGGGGPGVGPIGVKSHLAPFLPGHPERPDLPARVGPVSAAPFGSASILPISWTYILMMGADGLADATRTAILNANYIASRLKDFFPILFQGRHARVAHECIFDLRPFKESAGIEAEDVAKRLIDYGFHAPTMSFPVAGTLMVEPTESESKVELDRFCDAMIAIRKEIAAIESGQLDRADNMIRGAPHTVFDLADDNWQRPYTRAQACFPLESLRHDKYWSPVNRIDNVAGDRNLVCSCQMNDLTQTAAE
jgi:glycine dehydrogenase